jgi:thymidylate synthase
MSFGSMDELFRFAVWKCIEHGRMTKPRGFSVLEIATPTVLTLRDVHRPFIHSPLRRPNYRFGLVEAAWIAAGSDRLAHLSAVNSRMARFSDDDSTMWGGYGPRVIGQLDHVIETLRRDNDSRQAVVTTWRPMVPPVVGKSQGPIRSAGLMATGSETVSPTWDGYSWRSKDVPCTVAWHFQLRNGGLALTVFMRSNDVWLGLPYDVLSFTTIQRVVASALGVRLGAYHHVVSNLHLYQKNYEAAVSLMGETVSNETVVMPPFDDLFLGGSSDSMSTIFNTTLNGSLILMSKPGMQPFISAVIGSDEWDDFRKLMAANGR